MTKRQKRTHWFSLFTDRNTAVYFNSFGTEYIPKEFSNKEKDKSTTQNIFRAQDNDSIMCRFYCIAFIEYMLYENFCYITLQYYFRFHWMTKKRMTK